MKSIAARKSKIGNRPEPKSRIEEPETVDLEKAFSAARGFFSQIKKQVSKKKDPVFNKVKVNRQTNAISFASLRTFLNNLK